MTKTLSIIALLLLGKNSFAACAYDLPTVHPCQLTVWTCAAYGVVNRQHATRDPREKWYCGRSLDYQDAIDATLDSCRRARVFCHDPGCHFESVNTCGS